MHSYTYFPLSPRAVQSEQSRIPPSTSSVRSTSPVQQAPFPTSPKSLQMLTFVSVLLTWVDQSESLAFEARRLTLAVMLLTKLLAMAVSALEGMYSEKLTAPPSVLRQS